VEGEGWFRWYWGRGKIGFSEKGDSTLRGVGPLEKEKTKTNKIMVPEEEEGLGEKQRGGTRSRGKGGGEEVYLSPQGEPRKKTGGLPRQRCIL